MAKSIDNEMNEGRRESVGELTLPNKFVSINSPSDLGNLANSLKTFVVENNLYTEIENKNHVHVEGWQFAGASMGIFAQVVSTEQIHEDGNISFQAKKWYKDENGKSRYEWETRKNPIFKYKATVELVNITTGNVVGRGEAICSNQESKKKTFDEYAVLSMAQTRATGKAFRLSIGWVMKLAGYDGTPAEEMDDIDSGSEANTEEVITSIPIEDIKTIVDLRMAAMNSVDKIRFIKMNVNTINDKKLTDDQYMTLYNNLPRTEES